MVRWREDELKQLRKQAVEWLQAHGIPFRYLTCDKCPSRRECEYVYDPYNTDGDCLAEK